MCLDGAGACPPEDGNGSEKDRPGMMLSSLDPLTGCMTIDTLWVGECGNGAYGRAIAPGGCLHSRSNPDYAERHAEAVGSENVKHHYARRGRRIFDWTEFSLSDTNDRLAEALRHHLRGCLCCQEELSRPQKELKHLTLCAWCANASNLKFCSICGVVAYCCTEHQKKHWKDVHKNECVPAPKPASKKTAEVRKGT